MPRIQREQQTITAMINIFCHDHHQAGHSLCDNCQSLLDYAHARLGNCPFGDAKPACNKCTVHCYSANMREQVKQVMRYAGPRMPLRHPLLALGHLLDLTRDAPGLVKRRARGNTIDKTQE